MTNQVNTRTNPTANVFSNAKRKQRGQGMTEYIIIVALIAIAAITVFTLFGNVVQNQTAGIAQELSGNSASAAITAAGKAAGEASTDAGTKDKLDSYQNP